MKIQTPPIFITLVLLCLAAPKVFGVVPPPDGGYPNFTTAEGQKALQSLTTGAANTALGAYSLFSTTTASFNAAVGAGALDLNTADSNTAVGAAALLLNTTGTENTANGTAALEFNDTGSLNTAHGAFALFNNTTGSGNVAIGHNALSSANGSGNVAIGEGAGIALTAGDQNIYIATQGATSESNTIRIGEEETATFISGISGATVPGGVTVIVDSNGHLGTIVSSQRFKDGIRPMDAASEAILALKPVTFRYKRELDPKGIPQFGLVAEQVEKVNPDLVARDAKGQVYTVRYEAVNAMLLNEFLKEHRKVQELEATVAQQRQEMKAVIARLDEHDSRIQSVSDHLELSKPAPRTVLNNQ